MSGPVEPHRRGRSDSRASPLTICGGRAVVGFDDTDTSRNALAYAIGWARRQHGHLDVLFVPETPVPQWILEASMVVDPLGKIPESVDELSGRVASTALESLGGTDLSWTYQIAGGRTAHALERHADQVGADVIIIGRSRGRLYHPLRASIAHRLVSRTDRIVIVIP